MRRSATRCHGRFLSRRGASARLHFGVIIASHGRGDFLITQWPRFMQRCMTAPRHLIYFAHRPFPKRLSSLAAQRRGWRHFAAKMLLQSMAARFIARYNTDAAPSIFDIARHRHCIDHRLSPCVARCASIPRRYVVGIMIMHNRSHPE